MVWLLLSLLLSIGIGALISGLLLFLAPDGHLMMWSVEMLNGTPFHNFLVPGIILFLFIGVFSVFAVYGLLKRPWSWLETFNPCKDYHWPWTAAWAEGVIMLIWIAVETLLLNYVSFLQPLIMGWGVVIIVLTLLPPVRNYLRKSS